MKKFSIIFLIILAFSFLPFSTNFTFAQNSDEANQTVREFYEFHLSNDLVFSKTEIDKRKKFFTDYFYAHLIYEWKRDLDRRNNSHLKPDYDSLPFQPIGEVCGNWYKLGKPIPKENDGLTIKVFFFYNEDCGSNEFITAFEIELARENEKWLISDIGNVKEEIANKFFKLKIAQENQNSKKTKSKVPISEDLDADILSPWGDPFPKTVRNRTNEAGFNNLKETSLAENDLEIRVWVAYGTNSFDGFFLKRTNNQWEAILLDEERISNEITFKIINLKEPKSGWEQAWKKLLDAKILVIPEPLFINCVNLQTNHGLVYMVEMKKGDKYRNYEFLSPEAEYKNKCEEAYKFVEAIEILKKEFEIESKFGFR